ncbi:hypothetical protein PCYB_003380 [Plasmodium cynomolgi strain B]|uniref:Methyltransferase n=1 Tax=Plasmodium cynomolgi (strain B) TaxID=1120755 RepID=K6V005_PLACD|nr:hypothetical protein PCYB_003380 [Plasmodium cynomolgi strain B]GAB69589.1 hypothetical protein PCYB_003380 [Plasmodium cynomolgi strain B]
MHNGDSRQDVGEATLNSHEETWRKQICLYKEANKIDLLKKNQFDKSILSEAFIAQDENILHLVLSPPMSSVLEELDVRAMSGMSSGVANRGDRTPNSHKDTALTTNLEEGKIIHECTHELLINEKAKNRTLSSNKMVFELGAGSGLASISLFTHANIFRNGTNQGQNQVVITDVNPFTLSNLSHKVLLKE